MRKLLLLIVGLASMTTAALVRAAEPQPTAKGDPECEIISRQQGNAVIDSLMKNNSYIDYNADSIRAEFGSWPGPSVVCAKMLVANYRVYNRLERVNGWKYVIDATPEELNISPRVFADYKRQFDYGVNADIVKKMSAGATMEEALKGKPDPSELRNLTNLLKFHKPLPRHGTAADLKDDD